MTEFQRGNSRAAKLNAAQVYEIREKYQNGNYTQARLCREYGVNLNTIGRIVRGEAWQAVPEPLKPVDLDATIARLAAFQQCLTDDAAGGATQVTVDKELDKFQDLERAAQFGVKTDR